VVRAGKTSREPSYARAVRVLDGAGERSRFANRQLLLRASVVDPIRAVSDEKHAAGRFRVRPRNAQAEGSSRIERNAALPPREPRRDRNKIRARAALKTRSPAWETKCNLRDKRQDP
jgi:hypothetical protein